MRVAVRDRPFLRHGADRYGPDVGSLLEGAPVPLTDWELWSCANQVLKTHGDHAPRHVAEQIGTLVLAGDEDGIRTWQAIAARIAELAELKPGSVVRH